MDVLDHDAQVLKMNDVNLQLQNHHTYTTTNINNYSIQEFKTRLSYESWDSTFGYNRNIDIYILFNLFSITISGYFILVSVLVK